MFSPWIQSLRRLIGRLAAQVVPSVDAAVGRRDRRRRIQGALLSETYTTGLVDLPKKFSQRPTHLVVIPQVGPEVESWRPAGGNFLFEVAQSAREVYGADKVSVFGISGDEVPADWHVRLIRYLLESGATHVIAQVEADPNTAQQRYSWDVLWTLLSQLWDGVLLGLVTDSHHKWIRESLRDLARISPRFVLVDICLPMDGVLVRGRPEVGPVNMPISNLTLSVLDDALGSPPRVYDVSFIGTLYPFRVKLLEEIRATGTDVAVNPHRVVPAIDYLSSRQQVPSYLDYMRALAQSRITINFSQANAGSEQQLKTRVLEATLMGCLVLTDDVDRTSRFWRSEEEFGYFSTSIDLPATVVRWLEDREALEQASRSAQNRARKINNVSFWHGVDAVLADRMLRPISRE